MFLDGQYMERQFIAKGETIQVCVQLVCVLVVCVCVCCVSLGVCVVCPFVCVRVHAYVRACVLRVRV